MRCVRDQPVADTVSAVAGGPVVPVPRRATGPRGRLGAAALERFTALAADPASGCGAARGDGRRAGPARPLVDAGPALVAGGGYADELPTGRDRRGRGHGAARDDAGLPPVARGPVRRGARRARRAAGGRPRRRRWLTSSSSPLACGPARSLGDDAPTPSRGQVALLANPGLTRWLVDDDHPAGMVYALPHPGWVVCGGTDVGGTGAPSPTRACTTRSSPASGRSCRSWRMPGCSGSRVGLRPVAPAVRLARHPASGPDVVTQLRPRRRGRHAVVGVRRRGRAARRRERRVGTRPHPVGLRRAGPPYGAAGAKGRISSSPPCTVRTTTPAPRARPP